MLPTITSDLTKSQIKNISQQFIEAISENGRIIETAELIAKMEAFIKEIRSSKDFIDMVRDEVTKEGSKAKVTVTGVKIELAETGVKYDFSQCNDYDLNCLLEESERLEVQIKERKEFLACATSFNFQVHSRCHGQYSANVSMLAVDDTHVSDASGKRSPQ